MACMMCMLCTVCHTCTVCNHGVANKVLLQAELDSHALCRFNEAADSEHIPEPNAMCIATATREGRPSNRMVSHVHCTTACCLVDCNAPIIMTGIRSPHVSNAKAANTQVLMKGYDQRGFMFYTNYSSRKGQELQRNSYASLCFWWEPLHRSVCCHMTLVCCKVHGITE